MRVLLLILILISSRILLGQLPENRDFSSDKRDKFEASKYFAEKELLPDVQQHDLSKLLLTRHHDYVRGYIGVNFRRLDVRYISIVKNNNDPTEYFVYGKSRVGSNVVEFQGTLSLLSAKKYSDQYFDDKTMGSVLGKYVLYENPNQNHVGTFAGYFTSSWILDKNSNELAYDETNLGADGFSNNSFVGTWLPYDSNNFKTCNWGEYRIPYSEHYQFEKEVNALDIGAGEFSPADEFLKFGWQTYKDNLINYYTKRIPFPKDIWWKE